MSRTLSAPITQTSMTSAHLIGQEQAVCRDTFKHEEEYAHSALRIFHLPAADRGMM